MWGVRGGGSHSTPGSRDPSVQGRGGARPRGHAGRRDPGNSTRVTWPTKSRRTPTTTTPAFPLNGSLTLSREITPSLRFSYKNLPRPMILQSFYRPSISMLCFFFFSKCTCVGFSPGLCASRVCLFFFAGNLRNKTSFHRSVIIHNEGCTLFRLF